MLKRKKKERKLTNKPLFPISTNLKFQNYSLNKTLFKLKRTLSEHEEFELMKLVLDKFLWLGTGLFGWGLYVTITQTFEEALYFILSGIVFVFLFAWILAKEFEQRR